VATGSIDGPWGLLFAGKLTLATPIPTTDSNACYGAPQPTGSNCTPISGTPSGAANPNDPHSIGPQGIGIGGDIFGYRSIDMQITKNFDLTAGYSMYVRFDALNIFNYHNYSDYISNWGSNGVLNQYPVSYNSIGNITGVPRTFKLTAGFRF
jgi:hypothetical protein